MSQDATGFVQEERDMTDVPHELQPSQSLSSIIASPNGSITHPYRTSMKDTSFPRYHLMAKPGIDAETFNRSLSMLGNGFPLWDPIGNYNRPKEQLNSGLCVGDVGFLTRKGYFQRYFNLFVPPDRPGHYCCPPDLVPLEPPLDSEISVNHTYFPPGTALVSNGIESSVLSSSPMYVFESASVIVIDELLYRDIQFTFNTREGGIIVFPDGATREDLVSTTLIRDYVKKHALNWYVYFKERFKAVIQANGSLYVITGTDKAKEWASCVTSNGQPKIHRLWKPLTITYRGSKEDSPHDWDCDLEHLGDFADKISRPLENVGQCALFIRGMRISVNVLDWTQHVLQNTIPREIHYCVVRTTPAFGLRARIQTLNECRNGYFQRLPEELGDCLRMSFHPLDIISKLLLAENPSCTVAVVDDSIWSAVADKSDASLDSIIRLLIEVLDTYEIFIQDGLITLIPRTNSEEQAPSTSPSPWLIPTYIGHKYRKMWRLRQISSRLAKVFPGADVPNEYLHPWFQS